MLTNDLTLKVNELCLIGKAHSLAARNESGLYARDTRFLRDITLTLGDVPLDILVIQEQSPAHVRMVYTNMLPYQQLQAHEILLTVTVLLSAHLSLEIDVHNYGRQHIDAALTVELTADFSDMFDVRGLKTTDPITPQQATIEGGRVLLRGVASDGEVVSTSVTWSGEAEASLTNDPAVSGVRVCWPMVLNSGATAAVNLTIQPKPNGTPFTDLPTNDARNLFTTATPYATGDPSLDRVLNQCDADLAVLQTSFPEGVIPAAGVPWFIAPFGRDSMITCLQTMHRYPHRAQDALRVLASLQGNEIDPFREEQPGKIPHEMRYGELARRGLIPHTPYYGSVDSTPLFLMTLAACDAALRDDAFFDSMRPHAERAFAWVEEFGDLDGDGLIEFAGTSEDATHISQQGWKDSFDSLHFADGREVQGPIALIEPQAYVYAAYAGYADALEHRGEDASRHRARAEQVRDAIETRFWMDDAGYYAQALDGHKQPVDAISSNAGHVLYCGVASQDHADQVAARMALPDMNGGWGLRTLSSDMTTYNPMSYHNGSVWPHDVSLAMAGLYRYGHREHAQKLARQLVKLATFDPHFRLAELYSGFPDDGAGPVPYPVSCSPQAWAAGAGVLAAQVLGFA